VTSIPPKIEPLRKRIWCETLSHQEIVAQSSLSILRRGPFDAIVAVQPESLGTLARAVSELRSAGLFVAVWPMLSNHDGRWLSMQTSVRYVNFFERVVEALATARAMPNEFVIDIEPHFELLSSLKDRRIPALRRAFAHTRRGELAPLVSFLSSLRGSVAGSGAGSGSGASAGAVTGSGAGVRLTSAVLPTQPFVVLRKLTEVLFGLPSFEALFDSHNVMLYSTIMQEWGALSRTSVERVSRHTLRKAKQRWGERASVSLGAVGVGAFGDEPVYASIDLLKADLALALREGVREIALFDLGGILRRPDPQAWIAPLVEAHALPH
jgi:hypothetical protein